MKELTLKSKLGFLTYAENKIKKVTNAQVIQTIDEIALCVLFDRKYPKRYCYSKYDSGLPKSFPELWDEIEKTMGKIGSSTYLWYSSKRRVYGIHGRLNFIKEFANNY